MTTGRINQVTTFHSPTSQRTWSKHLLLVVGKPLSQVGVRHQQLKIQMRPRNAFHGCTSKSEPANETPCSPISQISDTLLPVTEKQQRSWSSERTTHNRQSIQRMSRTVMADSQVVNCNRFSYQQVIHILPPLQAPSRYSSLRGNDRINPHISSDPSPSQSTLFVR